MPARPKQSRGRRARRADACRPCGDLTRFVAEIVAILGDGWWDQCSEIAGHFSAHHQDGRRIKFYPPHNTSERIATAYLEVPGGFDYVTEGASLLLPMDLSPAAAAAAIVRMPIEPQPSPCEPEPSAGTPLQVSVRAQLGRLHAALRRGGVTVSKVRQHSFNTGSVTAVGAFGEALIVVDAGGLVRLTIHNMPEPSATAVLIALGDPNEA